MFDVIPGIQVPDIRDNGMVQGVINWDLYGGGNQYAPWGEILPEGWWWYEPLPGMGVDHDILVSPDGTIWHYNDLFGMYNTVDNGIQVNTVDPFNYDMWTPHNTWHPNSPIPADPTFKPSPVRYVDVYADPGAPSTVSDGTVGNVGGIGVEQTPNLETDSAGRRWLEWLMNIIRNGT